MKRNFKSLFIISIFLFAAGILASAETYTWTGNVNDAWGNNSNWKTALNDPAPNFPNNSSDDVVIPNTTLNPKISNDVSINSLTINSGGALTLGTGGTITLSGDFTNDGTFTADPGTTVTLSPSGNTVTITGTSTANNTKFNNLSLTNAGGKTLSINGKISVAGSLNLSGTSSSSKLTVQGSSPSDFNIQLTSDQIPDSSTKKGYYLDVQSSIPISSKTYYIALSSLPASPPANWKHMSSTWKTTATTTAWNTASNWTPEAVPTADWPVIIPAGGTNYPVLTGDVSAQSVTVQQGAELYLQGSIITQKSLKNSGTVYLNGTGAQKTWLESVSRSMFTHENGSTIVYQNVTAANAEIWNGPYQNLTFESGVPNTIKAASLEVKKKLIVQQSITIDTDSGSQTYGEDVTLNADTTFSASGSITFNQAINAGTKNVIFGGTGTINTQAVTAADITVDTGTGAWTSSGAITAQNISVYRNWTSSGNITAAGNIGVDNSSHNNIWTASSGDIKVKGNLTAAQFDQTSGTLTFNGTGTPEQELKFTGAGNKNINNLTIDTNAGVKLGSEIRVKGAFLNKGSFTHNNQKITFTGNNASIGESVSVPGNITEFYDIEVGSSALLTLYRDINIKHDLIVTDNNTFTVNGKTVSFVKGAAAPVSAASTISGNAVSFTNLRIESGKTLTVNNAGLTISGTLTNDGTFTAGTNKVTFRSGNSGLEIVGTGPTMTFYEIEILTGANLALKRNITITKAFVNAGQFTADPGTTVTLSPTGGTVTITGVSTGSNPEDKTKFHNLSLTNAGGKKLVIDKKISVSGNVILEGSGAGDSQLLTVEGGTNSPGIKLSTTQANGKWLKVKSNIPMIPETGGKTYTVTESKAEELSDFPFSDGNPKNWIFTGYTGDMTWKGNHSSNWSDWQNWRPYGTPGVNSDVTIPQKEAAAHYPKLTANVSAKSVTVNSGAELDLGGQIIKKGTGPNDFTPLTNNGTLKMTGTADHLAWFRAGNNNKISLNENSTVEYYGNPSTASDVWEGPYQNLKVSDVRQTLNASSMEVKQDLTITRSPVTITTTGNQTYHGNVIAFKEVAPSSYTYYDLTLTGGTIKTSNTVTAGNLTVRGGWSSKKVDARGNIEVNTTPHSSSNTWTAGGEIFVKGNLTAAQLNQTSGTLTFNGNGTPQTLSFTNALGNNIHNLTIDNGAASPASNANVKLDTDIEIKGTFLNKGTFTHNNQKVTFTGNASIVTSGDSGQITEFYDIEIASSASLTLNQDIKIKKDFSNSGGFTVNGKTVSFVKGSAPVSAASTISGNAVSFANLSIESGKTLTLNNASLEISGTLTNDGIFDAQTNSKTVTFTGTNAEITRTQAAPSPMPENKFYDLKIADSATLKVVLSGINNNEHNKFVKVDIKNSFINGQNGIFIPHLSNFVFSGTNASTNSGNNNINFTDITIPSTGSLTLNKPITVGGTFKNDGTFNDGNKKVTFRSGNADLQITGTATTMTFSDVEILSGANLALKRDITVAKELKNAGQFTADSGTTVTLAPAGNTITITGTGTAANTKFHNLNLTGAGGKTLKIDGKITVNGDLNISGSGQTSLLTIQGNGAVSAPPVAKSEITLANSYNGPTSPPTIPPQAGYYLNICSDIPITSGHTYTTRQSKAAEVSNLLISDGHPKNWIFEDYIGEMEWSAKEANDTDKTKWDKSKNWIPNGIPGTHTKVNIPTGINKYPKLENSTNAKAEKITVEGELDLAGHVITDTLNTAPLTNNGLLKMTGTANQKTWFEQASADDKITLGDNSTIEYYGSTNNNVWKGPYKNLSLDDRPNLKTDNEDLIVSGNLTIKSSNMPPTPLTDINTGSGTQTYNGSINAEDGTNYRSITFTGSTITTKDITAGSITVTGDWTSTGNITAFGNITADNTAHNNTWTAKNVTLKGNLTAAQFNQTGGALSFNGGGTTQTLTFTSTSPTTQKNINNLIINNNAKVQLDSDITIKGDLTNSGTFDATTAPGYTVTLTNGADHTITGTGTASDTKFHNLSLTGAGGKKLTIDKKISVSGNLTLTGTSTDKLSIEGNSTNSSITLTSANSAKGQFLKVKTNIPIASGGTYTAEDSLPDGLDNDIQAGKPENWIFTNYNGTVSWTGKKSNVWADHRNWNPYVIPGKNTIVTIPQKTESAHHYPLLGANAEANTVTVQNNASLDIAGFVIDDNSGRSPLAVHGTLKLKGTADQKNWFAPSNPSDDKINLQSTSTVIYYDNSTANIWGGTYYKLQAQNRDKLVTGGVPITVESTFKVTHTTPSSTLEIDTGTASQTYKGDIDGSTNNLKFTANLLTTMNSTSRNIKAADITVTGNWDNNARITTKTIEVQGLSGLQSDSGDIFVAGNFTVSKFIQNRGNLTFNGTGTQTLSTQSSDSKIKNLVINANATVKLSSDITIRSNFTNRGTFDATNTGSPPGYTVTLTNDGNHDITGSNTAAATKFYNLICINAGGKQIQFKNNISVYGKLTLRGSAPNNVLNLSGTNPIESPPGTPNPNHSGTIYINADKNPPEPNNCKWLGIATNLPIKSLDSNTYTCTASESTPTGNFEDILPLLIAGHPKNWVFTNLDKLAWTGETDTDWNNPGNWRPRPSAAPQGTEYVTIRNVAAGNRLPVLGTGTYRANEVDIRGNVTLDLGGSVIYKGTTGSNTTKLTTKGTLKLKGTPAQKTWFEASNDNKIHLDINAETATVVYHGGSAMPSTAADIWAGPYRHLEINGGKTKLNIPGNLTVNGNFTVKTETQLSATGDLTVKKDFTIKAETTLSATGKITVEGKTAIEAAASLQAGTADRINTKDIFINAPAAATVVNFKSPLKASSFVLYGGTVSLTDNCTGVTAENDIVLFGSGYRADDTPLGADGTGLFTYNNGKRAGKTASPSITLTLPASFSGSFADLSDKTLKADKNFYANGITLVPTGTWTLDIPNNDNATNAFAEAYCTTVKNCTVKTNGSTETKAFVAAAEGCTDSGGNTGWDFARPTIERAYTVWDDVICLEFSEPIENSNNEISKALTNIKLNNGATAFSGAYTNKECTVSTNNQGDLSTFYLKSSVRWNTDATGSSTGNLKSTDMGRSGIAPAHSSVVPDLDIPKAHSDTDPLKYIYETLRDEHKNRITHYSGTTRLTTVEDNCPPVLTGVYTGQEMHTNIGIGTQTSYDAHNFIEFRYSEPVNIYENTTDTAAIVLSDSAVNIRATDGLGKITPYGSGLRIAGFADIASGSLSAASKDGGIPHSLYRNFSTAHGSAAAAQSHRVRLSIAGYVDGTKTVGAYTVHNWIGYIDAAQMPSGTAKPVSSGPDKFAVNGFIRSVAAFDPDGTGPLPAKPVVSVKGEYEPVVNSNLSAPLDAGNLHGSWDTLPPVFAKYTKDETGWTSPSSLNEIIGFASSNIVEKLEFHFFDNSPSYTSGETFRWQSTDGTVRPTWLKGGTSLSNTSYDKLGGSRFDPSGTAPTEGGIRASSLSGSIGAFGFRKRDSSGALIRFEGTDTDIIQTALNTVLYDTAMPSGRNPADTLYLQLKIQNATTHAFPITQAFSIEYDQNNGFVTDLAGNRMRTQSAVSIDLTPPRIVLSIAPVGSKKVYILFNTPINTDAAHLAGIPHNLEIAGSTNSFDTSKPAQVRTHTDSGTGLILHLNNPIGYSDITKPIHIKAALPPEPPMSIKRTIIGLVPAIGPAHALSDFAVNVIRPLYVHDDSPGGGEGFQSLANGLAMRIFDGSGGPGNTVIADKELTIAVLQENNGNADSLEMYYDTAPLPESVSVVFNLATGLNGRVWLPTPLDALSFNHNNSAAHLSLSPGGSSSVFSNPGQPLTFPPDKTVQVLFGLKQSGILITIDHDADGSTQQVPLYALRLKDPDDPASIDLWSFNTAALKPQRGGVSVLNNVINTSVRENVVVQVQTEKAGSLSVLVMTLDGDVVRILHSGRVEKGEHIYKWDGRNANGEPVARGLYFIRIVGPDIDETRKVMAVRE